MIKIKSSEITPEHIYLSRRKFLKGIGALAATSVLAACGVQNPVATEPATTKANTRAPEPSPDTPEAGPTSATTDELGNALTSHEAVTNFNNFYEFTTNKEGVAGLAQNFKTSPWTALTCLSQYGSRNVGGVVMCRESSRDSRPFSAR